MNDNEQRSVLEQMEGALRSKESSSDSRNATIKIPTVLYDFHMSVDKLLELKGKMSDPTNVGNLTTREQADGFIASSVVKSILDKTQELISVDYKPVSEILSDLGINVVVNTFLEDTFQKPREGEPDPTSKNEYLADNARERLETFYEGFGSGSDQAVGSPDYAHSYTREESDSILEHVSRDDDSGEIELVQGHDAFGHSDYMIRNISPDAESFLTSVSQEDKIKNYQEYMASTDEKNDTESESKRVDSYLSERYVEAAQSVLGKDNATGDELQKAAGWLEKGGASASDIESTHMKAAEAFDKEGNRLEAYREYTHAGDNISQEDKGKYIDNAIQEAIYGQQLDKHVADEEKLTEAVEETHDPSVIRESLKDVDLSHIPEEKREEVINNIDALLKEKEISMGLIDPDKEVVVENNDVSVEDAPAEAIKTDISLEEDFSSPDSDVFDATSKSDEDTGAGYEFKPEENTNAEGLIKKAAENVVEIIKDPTNEEKIRKTLGNEKAEEYKERVADFVGAIAKNDGAAAFDAGNAIIEIINAVPEEETDRVDKESVDFNPETNASSSNSGKSDVLDKLLELGKLAYIDPNNNRAIRYQSRNPYQLSAIIDYCNYAKHLSKDEYKEATGQDKPKGLWKASFIASINLSNALTLSNLSSVWSEALYQEFLRDAKNETDNEKNDLVDKARAEVIKEANICKVHDALQDPSNELAQKLKDEMGEDKFNKFEKAIENAYNTGNNKYIREANIIANSSDSVGGRDKNERYDRRDLFQNWDILENAIAARKEGREINFTIPGRGTETGKVTRTQVVMAFINVFSNSELAYSIGKHIYEGIQDSFFSIFNTKRESIGDMIEKATKNGGPSVRRNDFVDKQGNEHFIERSYDSDNNLVSEKETISKSGSPISQLERSFKYGEDGKVITDKNGKPLKDIERGTFTDRNGTEHRVDRFFDNSGRAYGTDTYTDKDGNTHSIVKKDERTTISSVIAKDGHYLSQIETTYKLDKDGHRVSIENRDVKDTEKGTYTDNSGAQHDVDRKYDDQGRMFGTDRAVDKDGHVKYFEIKTNDDGKVERHEINEDKYKELNSPEAVDKDSAKKTAETGVSKQDESKPDDTTSKSEEKNTNSATKPDEEKDEKSVFLEAARSEIKKDNCDVEKAKENLISAGDKAKSSDWLSLGDKYIASNNTKEALVCWIKGGLSEKDFHPRIEKEHPGIIKEAYAAAARDEMKKDDCDTAKAKEWLDAAGDKAEKADYDKLSEIKEKTEEKNIEKSEGDRVESGAEEEAHKEDDQAAEEEAHSEDDQPGDVEAHAEDDQSAEEEAHKEDDQAAEEEAHSDDDQSGDVEAHAEDDQSAEEEAHKEDDQAAEEEAHSEDDQSGDVEAHAEDDQSAEEEAHKEDDQAAEEEARTEDVLPETPDVKGDENTIKESENDSKNERVEKTSYTEKNDRIVRTHDIETLYRDDKIVSQSEVVTDKDRDGNETKHYIERTYDSGSIWTYKEKEEYTTKNNNIESSHSIERDIVGGLKTHETDTLIVRKENGTEIEHHIERVFTEGTDRQGLPISERIAEKEQFEDEKGCVHIKERSFYPSSGHERYEKVSIIDNDGSAKIRERYYGSEYDRTNGYRHSLEYERFSSVDNSGNEKIDKENFNTSIFKTDEITLSDFENAKSDFEKTDLDEHFKATVEQTEHNDVAAQEEKPEANADDPVEKVDDHKEDDPVIKEETTLDPDSIGAIELAHEYDGMFPDERPDDAPDIYKDAAEAVLSMDKPSGDMLKEAAGWFEASVEAGGDSSLTTKAEETHAMACEAYLKEGDNYSAYKEAMFAKDNISDDLRADAVEAYAKDCLEAGRNDTDTWIHSARLFDLLPENKQNTPEAKEAFEKGAEQMSRRNDVTRSDLEVGISWANKAPDIDPDTTELLGAKLKNAEINYEVFAKEMIEPAVVEAIGSHSSIDMESFYNEVKDKLDVLPAYKHDGGYTKSMFIEDVNTVLSEIESKNSDDANIELEQQEIDDIRGDIDMFEADADLVEIEENDEDDTSIDEKEDIG